MTDLRKRLPCTVNILGTPYRVEMRKYEDDKTFELQGFSAYCWESEKLIVVGDMDTFDGTVNAGSEKEDKIANRNCECRDLRHEIVHAYLNESGLSSCSENPKNGWAKNEEMVDWFAIQSPKIFKTYKELGIL